MKNHQGYSHVGYKIGHKFKALLGVALALWGQASYGQTNGPRLVDPKLDVRAVVTNLSQPTTMAFLKHNDFLEGTEVCGFAILDFGLFQTENAKSLYRRAPRNAES